MILLPLTIAMATLVADPAPAAAPALTPASASLAAAEFAFNDKAAKDGSRASFLANFHQDGVYYIPRPVKGVDYWKTQLEFDTLLQWFPIRVETSSAGDLGYTTGPWTYKLSKDATEEVYGWYVSLWQRDGEGPWKVRLDIGINTPDPKDLPAQTPLPRVAAALPPAPTVHPASSPELVALDKAFGEDASKANNITTAYKNRIDPSVRFYRKGRFPLEGASMLQRYLDPWAVDFQPSESIISGSNDLGLTRGTMTRKEPSGATTSNYIHIWKKAAGSWKLALEVEVPTK
jgi:ketosteroid isomerase-like protein